VDKTSYAEVAVPLHVFQTFTYRLTPEQTGQAEVGARLVVPLGRSVVTGYILGLQDEPAAELVESDIKDAKELLDETPVCGPEILQLARWVADYYACPIGEVIKAALPPGMSPKRKTTPVIQAKLRRFVRLLQSTSEQKLTDAQRRVLATLTASGPMQLQA
jgi:primosomal protein N'